MKKVVDFYRDWRDLEAVLKRIIYRWPRGVGLVYDTTIDLAQDALDELGRARRRT